MDIDERARHRLYDKLEQVLGSEEATILMAHLPPVGWADVATKRDLDVLSEINKREHETLAAMFKKEHEALEYRLLAKFRAELLQQTRTMIIAMTTATISIGTLAFAAARLT